MTSIASVTFSIQGCQQKIPLGNSSEASQPLEINLGNEISNQNLFKLCTRKKGTYFRVIETEGRQQRLEKVEGIRNRFSYWRNRTEEEKKVAQVVKEIICGLENALKASDVAIAIQRFVIGHFFSPQGKIGRLSPRIFEVPNLDKESHLSCLLLPEHSVRIKDGDGHYLTFISQELPKISASSLLSLELTDEIKRKNFWSLLTRKKGEMFWVVDGKLTKVSGLCNRIRYRWNQTAREAEVKGVVGETLSCVEELLETVEETQLKTYRTVLSHFFHKNGPIGSLSKRLFSSSQFDHTKRLAWCSLPKNTIWLRVGDEYQTMTSERLSDRYLGMKIPHDLSLEDPKLSHIFACFLRRKRHERFFFDKNHQLVKAEGLRNRIHYWLHRKTLDETLKKTIRTAIEQLEISRSNNPQSDDRLVLSHYFQNNGSFARLSQRVFDRSVFHKKTYLEHLLNEEIADKRAKFKEALLSLQAHNTNQTQLEAEQACMDLVFAEMTLAHSLGVPLKKISSGGSGGARFAYDRFNHTILVVKPGDEGPHGINNPKWYAGIKQFFVSQRGCLAGNSEPLAELDSYVMDRKFGLNVVPPTDLRFVESKEFNGYHFKECSIQMFVDGSVTLREFLGIPAWMQSLPRWFLRWYLGGLDSENSKHIPRFLLHFLTSLRSAIGGESLEKEINHKLPEKEFTKLLARVGVQDFISENTDCHFENILFKRIEEKPPTLIEKIFKSEDVSENEIDNFISEFFHHNHFQEFLEQLFHSKLVTVEEVNEETQEKVQKKYKVMLIKHDGGSSNPHRHPRGYLSQRFKHLFEVLPHFNASFPRKTRNIVLNQDEQFEAAIREKAFIALRKVMEEIRGKDCFENIWERYHLIFLQWINSSNTGEKKLREMILNFFELEANEKKYAEKALERIHKNIQTRRDSWSALQRHLNDDHMRSLFQITSEEDFERELKAGRTIAHNPNVGSSSLRQTPRKTNPIKTESRRAIFESAR